MFRVVLLSICFFAIAYLLFVIETQLIIRSFSPLLVGEIAALFHIALHRSHNLTSSASLELVLDSAWTIANIRLRKTQLRFHNKSDRNALEGVAMEALAHCAAT